MLVKILKHGSGKSRGGTSAKEYLLGKNNERVNARLLKGDPDITTEIINGLKFNKTYTSGGIHFAYDEAKNLTEKDKYDIIESFEKAMFPNLEPSQYSGYWVEHTDKVNDKGERRLELNFIYANIDLESNKALPVYYHANDVHLTSSWRDYTNIKYDLIDPLEIQRQQTIKIASNLPQHKKEILQDIHEIVTAKVVTGDIKNRADIVETLEKIEGIELLGKPLKNKYITIRDPDNQGKNIRLKGAIYDDPKWTIENFIRELEETKTVDDSTKSKRLAKAEERLQHSTSKRAERFEKRFSNVAKRSIERAERLEQQSIAEFYDKFRDDKKSNSKIRETGGRITDTSGRVREEREQIDNSIRQQIRADTTAGITATQDSEHQALVTTNNTNRYSNDNNIVIKPSSDINTDSNVNNIGINRKNKTLLYMDIGLSSSVINNNRFNSVDRQNQKGRINANSRTNNNEEFERTSITSTETDTRAIESIRDSRTETINELAEQFARTSASIYDFTEQIRPSPFNKPVRERKSEDDSDREENDEHQYTYDRDREREREQNNRIESAFRQIDKFTEQSIHINEEFIRATEEIEQKLKQPEPKPEPKPETTIRRGFRP